MKSFTSSSLTPPDEIIIGKNHVDVNTDIRQVTVTQPGRGRRNETEPETIYKYTTTRYTIAEYLAVVQKDIAWLRAKIAADEGDEIL